MKKKIAFVIILALCFNLWACDGASNAVETTAPTELPPETSPAELPRLTKEEMQLLAVELKKNDIDEFVSNLGSADGMIGTVYTFDGIINSIEADHVIVSISLKEGTTVDGITADVYLSTEELESIVPLQKVAFIGRVDDTSTDESGFTRISLYSAAIVSDRFEFYGKFVELNPDAEPNTWMMQFTSSDVRAVTFVNSMDGCKGESHYYSYKEINGQYVDAFLLGPNGELVTYDPVLFNWPDIIEMAAPRLTLGEIQTMIADDLTLDKVAERIDTLADLVQYLHQKGFVFDGGDLQLWYGPCIWSVNRSAQTVFEENVGNCGGGSNLANYILSGDFEKQGYVKHSWNSNGHITNYFMQDGLYYFFDLTMITGREYQNVDRYEMYVTDDPQKFADDYIGQNHRIHKADSPDYLIFLSMYPWEGSHLPSGYGNVQQGWPRSYYQPKQYEDIIRILHAEEHGIPTFAEAPDMSLWPEEAQ